MSRIYTFYLAALVGAICIFFIVHAFFLGLFFVHSRTVRLDLTQGFLIGVGLAFVTAQAYARIKATKVNGWITMFGLGVPGNGMLLRAAHAQYFPGPVNVPEEAMYWWANVDGAGHTLNGEHDYMMHFPPGGLPPNEAQFYVSMSRARLAMHVFTDSKVALRDAVTRPKQAAFLLGAPRPGQAARKI